MGGSDESEQRKSPVHCFGQTMLDVFEELSCTVSIAESPMDLVTAMIVGLLKQPSLPASDVLCSRVN